MHLAWFLPIGIFVGTYGTIIGAGGGFILVPLLLLLFPDESPALVTATSLGVVLRELRLRLDRVRTGPERSAWKTGLLFALATIPGALAGSYLVKYIPRDAFARRLRLPARSCWRCTCSSPAAGSPRRTRLHPTPTASRSTW